MIIIMRIAIILFALATAGSMLAAPSWADSAISFNRDIRSILSDNCFYCHGPDAKHRQAELRLDDRAAAIDFGAFVPGNADESSIIQRIESPDADSVMPPPEAHKSLTSSQKALLRRWIEEGAEYEDHWAYVAPQRKEPLRANESQSAIDAYIQDSLRAAELKPAGEADKLILARRLYLDLIGLPPTPAQVQLFVNAKSPDAYENLVDQLLQSPHYGERMAIPWLDVVRYADTVGFHGDQNANVWRYRDYVIDSFNQNKPFDQFTIEQLAGDLLPNPTPEQLVATCFNRLNMMTREGGAQPKEYLAKYAADRVRTVGMTWLGSTFGCAECHDHKFDPISTKDFYSLAAFFADVKQWGVYSDYKYTPNEDLKGFTNEYPFPPEVVVSSDHLERRRKRLRNQIDQLVQSAIDTADQATSELFTSFTENLASFTSEHPDGWQVLTPAPQPEQVTAPEVPEPQTDKKLKSAKKKAAAGVPTYTVNDDSSVVFVGKSNRADEVQFPLAAGHISTLRIELIAAPEHDGQLLRSGKSDRIEFVPRVTISRSGSDKPVAVQFRYATADTYLPRYDSGQAVIGIQRNWKLDTSLADARVASYWLLETPIAVADGAELSIHLDKNSLGCVRVSVSPLAPPDIENADALMSVGSDVMRSHAATFLRSTNALANVRDQLYRLDLKLLDCRSGRTPVLVTEAISPAIVRVLPRGNWQDDGGEVVTPQTPHFLPGADPPDKRLTRLDLANWLVSTDNPLTSRVMVNRIWQQFFGTGLTARGDDFGAQGEPPSHPELLDYLAIEFRESGWDVKRLVKAIVMSSTYRQSSQPTELALQIDPENRLLSHQSPRRLEAELVRDNALAIAGLLDPELGGPSIKPYQPDGHYANLQFPDRIYRAETDTNQYRRGVYVHWQRTFLHPMLINFGAPTREDCIAARVRANTPQQALTLLNDPSMVEAARCFAERILDSSTGDDANRIDELYQLALARSPTSAESKSLQTLIRSLRRAYAQSPEDANKLIAVGIKTKPDHVAPVELAVWTNVCRVLFNLHETITRY